MKITSILAIIGIALYAAPAQAFFGPWGLGLMNPFMFGPWGMGMFGPWGMGFGLGFRRFGLGFGARRFIGKRGIEGVEDIEDNTDMTLCSYTSKNDMVSCHGIEHNFQCKVSPHFSADLKSGSYRIQNLTVVPDMIPVGKVDHRIYNLFSVEPTVGEVNDFTLIEKPERRVTFSVWKSSEVRRTGLRFVEEKCWKSFETLMAIPERVRFALFINREVKA